MVAEPARATAVSPVTLLPADVSSRVAGRALVNADGFMRKS